MNPKVFELKEVVIERPKFKKEIEIGENLQKNAIRITAVFSNLKGRYFPFKESYKETKFIKKVKIFTKSKIASAKFKLRVLGVNNLGYPGNDLMDEEIIITVKKGKNENAINFEKYNLVFPENGIFIAFETLFLEENKSFYNQPNKKIKAVSYEPGLVYNLVDDQNSFVFTEKGWYRFPKQAISQNRDFRKFDNKVFEPAINLILSN